jgi:hypothetical protein
MPRSKKDVAQKRKAAARKSGLKGKGRTPVKVKSAKSAGKSRAEGIRLFQLAGRPSQQDFIKVFGPSGPKLTWAQRAEAGVPAQKFQAALAAKQSARKDAKPSIPALTAKD